MLFQSTLPARGATLSTDNKRPDFAISIHAPRTGSDHSRLIMYIDSWLFQSTLPARGATRGTVRYNLLRRYFNPRSPHGERQNSLCSWQATQPFQSTLPARGATATAAMCCRRASAFQSTLPARGATRLGIGFDTTLANFNPRSPHGERLRKVTILSIRIIGFAQKVYHKTVLLRISLAENAVILPKRPRNPVRTSLQKAGGLRFARAIRAARPYSISSPSGA